MFGENTAVSTTAEGEARRPASVLRNRYVLEERLSQGRLGAMRRAADRLRGHAGREHVSILILPAEVSADPARLDAFSAGFEAVRTLSHPNIVELYDLDCDGDAHFVVLEWIDGESLRSVIDTLAPETVCEADALGVVRAVGSALIYAHAKGIVHGDVRPENVIVTEHGEVLLLFTPACLARSAPFSVTPRDDVRGLAALLYELMAGTPPPAGLPYGRAKDEEPPPIDDLGRKRWKALRRALSLRDGRIATVRQLLAALDLEPAAVSGRRGRKGYRAVGRKAGGIGRGVVWLAVLAAAIVGAYRYGSARAPDAVDLEVWSSELSAGFGRAASWTRATLVAARGGLERASGAVAAYLERAEAKAPSAEPDRADERLSSAPGDAIDTAAGETDVAGPEPGASSTAADSAAAADDASPASDASRDPEPEVEPSAAPGAADARSAAPPTAAEGSAAAEGSRAFKARDDAEAASKPEPDGGPAVYFVTPEVSVSESGGVAAIRVSRTNPRGTFPFVWWTRDGSAVAGEDYADLGRVVEQFAEGETMRTLYVPIVSDAVPEPRDKQFEVLVGALSPQGNQNGAIETARVTIVDDD